MANRANGAHFNSERFEKHLFVDLIITFPFCWIRFDPFRINDESSGALERSNISVNM